MNKLHDIIAHNLTILFIGFNPSLHSAAVGHHFAGHSNRFWKLLAQSELTPSKLRPEEDGSLLNLGYGITNIVARPTKAAAEITKDEYIHGRKVLKHKLAIYQPKIACYVGIGVYQQFSEIRQIYCGIQPINAMPNIIDFVVSSSSGLNRIPWNTQLSHFKQLRDLAYNEWH